MRYFVAAYREGAKPEDWAQPGEPVVPNFPTGARNTFLGTISFKPVPYAKVMDDPALTLDAVTDIGTRLKQRFKCLPHTLLDAYVLEMAKLAQQLPLGQLCTIMLDDDGEGVSVMLLSTNDIYRLWDSQPIPKELR